MKRRSFLGVLAGLLAVPRAVAGMFRPGAPAPRFEARRCVCCAREYKTRGHTVYDGPRFGRVPVRGPADGLTWDEIDFGPTYSFCDECYPHWKVIFQKRLRVPITARAIQTELTRQELTRTREGFYRALADKYMLLTGDTSAARGALSDSAAITNEIPVTGFEISTVHVPHFAADEWALVPV